MRLILPFPPSVNTYWRAPNKGPLKGRHMISEAGRRFQSDACAAIIEQLRRLPKPSSSLCAVEILLYRHHCDTLEIEGYTYRTETQTGDVLIKAHPAAIMKADAWKRLRAMLAEFGMTPASRSKVSIKKPGEVDPIAEFMKARD